jgi:hypothetical protein
MSIAISCRFALSSPAFDAPGGALFNLIVFHLVKPFPLDTLVLHRRHRAPCGYAFSAVAHTVEWVRQPFRRNGIDYQPSEAPSSQSPSGATIELGLTGPSPEHVTVRSPGAQCALADGAPCMIDGHIVSAPVRG